MQSNAADYRCLASRISGSSTPSRASPIAMLELRLKRCMTGELTVPGTPIRVVLSELFAELDQV